MSALYLQEERHHSLPGQPLPTATTCSVKLFFLTWLEIPFTAFSCYLLSFQCWLCVLGDDLWASCQPIGSLSLPPFLLLLPGCCNPHAAADALCPGTHVVKAQSPVSLHTQLWCWEPPGPASPPHTLLPTPSRLDFPRLATGRPWETVYGLSTPHLLHVPTFLCFCSVRSSLFIPAGLRAQIPAHWNQPFLCFKKTVLPNGSPLAHHHNLPWQNLLSLSPRL